MVFPVTDKDQSPGTVPRGRTLQGHAPDHKGIGVSTDQWGVSRSG